MSKVSKRVGKKIRVLLKARKLTAERLAFEIGMSKGYLSNFLTGKKGMSIDSLARIADGLEVDIKSLF